MTLEEQLSYLCNEAEYLPGYYGIAFSDITDEELKTLPISLLTALKNTFPFVKDNNWKEFRKRIKKITEQEISQTFDFIVNNT